MDKCKICGSTFREGITHTFKYYNIGYCSYKCWTESEEYKIRKKKYIEFITCLHPKLFEDFKWLIDNIILDECYYYNEIKKWE
jgi:hypothetical protein